MDKRVFFGGEVKGTFYLKLWGLFVKKSRNSKWRKGWNGLAADSCWKGSVISPDLEFFLFVCFCFLWYWGLNSGPQACWASAQPLESLCHPYRPRLLMGTLDNILKVLLPHWPVEVPSVITALWVHFSLTWTESSCKLFANHPGLFPLFQ
jgi:hypothetical protein